MTGIDLTNIDPTNINPTNLDATKKAANLAVDPQHQKIKKAAQEFEGLLMGALWKSMGEDIKDSLGEDSANGGFTDMGLQAVSGAMAASGGVGIGRMLLKSLEKEQVKDDLKKNFEI